MLPCGEKREKKPFFYVVYTTTGISTLFTCHKLPQNKKLIILGMTDPTIPKKKKERVCVLC